MLGNQKRSVPGTRLKSGLLLLTALGIIACDSGSSTEPEQLGRVTVTVKDDTNAPVNAILVNLYKTGSLSSPWAATTTNASGTGEFSASAGGVKAQSYVVRVVLPTNYTLAAGETNDKPLTVVASQTSNVSFTLTRKQIGQQ
jgi:hypothetical protein